MSVDDVADNSGEIVGTSEKEPVDGRCDVDDGGLDVDDSACGLVLLEVVEGSVNGD